MSSYNYFCNKQHFYEDGYEDPVWYRFKWEFWTDTKKTKGGKDSNTKVKEFEKLHPNLTLMMVDTLDKRIFVFKGPVLFRDEEKEFREIKYSYIRRGQERYYEPSKDLLDWFDCVDQFSQYRKQKKAEVLL